MTRPDHILCERCCYFEPMQPHPSDPDTMEGRCIRLPPHVADGADVNFPHFKSHALLRRTHGKLGCGEFRREWPDDPS